MDRVRIGLVGLGLMGTAHAETLQKIELCDLVAASDADGGRQKIAAEMGIHFYKSHLEMIRQEDLQGVVIAAPEQHVGGRAGPGHPDAGKGPEIGLPNDVHIPAGYLPQDVEDVADRIEKPLDHASVISQSPPGINRPLRPHIKKDRGNGSRSFSCPDR